MTTEKVANEISGRGLGLPAVKNEVDRLKGDIEIKSSKGKGTELKFTIPLC